jgi:hypothetical protein
MPQSTDHRYALVPAQDLLDHVALLRLGDLASAPTASTWEESPAAAAAFFRSPRLLLAYQP